MIILKVNIFITENGAILIRQISYMNYDNVKMVKNINAIEIK